MLRQKILKLREEGNTYNQIRKKLNCSKGPISYHCNDETKIKTKERGVKYRKNRHPYKKKIENFSHKYKPPIENTYGGYNTWKQIIRTKIKTFCGINKMNKNDEYVKPSFTVEDVIEKFGEYPKCYLTGKDIDIKDTKSYAFDHIHPRSRGGSNNIENLGICTKEANQSKSDMTLEEYFDHCEKVLSYRDHKNNLDERTNDVTKYS